MAMAASLVQLAKRALVTLILAFGSTVWRADVGCAKEDVVEAMYRKVVKSAFRQGPCCGCTAVAGSCLRGAIDSALLRSRPVE